MEDRFGSAPLFAGFDPAEVEALVQLGGRRKVPPGQVLVRMGDVNSSLFLVASGKVLIERRGVEGQTLLATLGAGQTFGEMSFLDGGRTSATVRAEGPTEVIELTSAKLAQLFAEKPAIGSKLWKNLALELKRRLVKADELIDHYVDLAQVMKENPAFAEDYARP